MAFPKKLDLLTIPMLLMALGHTLTAQQVTLNQNSGGISQELIDASSTCTDGGITYGRSFLLRNFGVTGNDQLSLESAEIAIKQWYRLDEVGMIRLNVYEVDENFPNSFDPTKLIGSSQDVEVPRAANTPVFAIGPVQLLRINFDNPILIPAGTKRVFVEVTGITPLVNSVYAVYSVGETDPAYYKTCDSGEYITALENAVPAQAPAGYVFPYYYLKVFGMRNKISDFHINYVSACSNLSARFELTETHEIASVIWDFGDPASATDNTSTNSNPTHTFSTAGTFSVTAQITTITGNELCIDTMLTVSENISVYPMDNLLACETTSGTGLSSAFDTSFVEETVLGGQTGVTVSYFDGHGNSLPSPLPNPMTNSIAGRETIVARVSDSNDPGCYAETSFDLIVNPLPVAHALQDIVVCDNNGIAEFDTSNVEGAVVGHQTGIEVSYLDAQGSTLPNPLPNPYTNTTPYQEIITVRVTNSLTGCMAETLLTLRTSDTLDIPSLPDVYACDEGSGYAQFDVSSIETQIIGSLTGLNVSYLNTDGQVLQDFPSTSYRNQEPYSQTVTVRVTDETNASCSSTTSFDLIVNPAPIAYALPDLVMCGNDGFAEFDISIIEDTAIREETGLEVSYLDAQGLPLPRPLPNPYTNTIPHLETIMVRVTDPLSGCSSETSLNLVVVQPPVIDLQETYYLCDQEPSITLAADHNADTWAWISPDGTIRATTPEVTLMEEGEYMLVMGHTRNGVNCESTTSLQLVRTQPPVIQELETGEDFSNDHYINVIASGPGTLEYSLDGEHYQPESIFRRLSGGVYTAYVRDRQGCGEDSMETILLDYPRYFTPNGDGVNDRWQIGAIRGLSGAQIQIFDRYGTLIWEIRANDMGWDGTYGGRPLPASDYWFALDLGNGREYKNHFALKR
ncbi:MAG: T9SS type B sorting domain-containing protein [Bacteroidota bacterium]